MPNVRRGMARFSKSALRFSQTKGVIKSRDLYQPDRTKSTIEKNKATPSRHAATLI